LNNSTILKRKCKHCSHWNIGNVDHCSNCDFPISAEKIIEKHERQLTQQFEIKRTVFDDFLDRMKQHRFFLVRAIFHILYATWSVVMFIISAILFLVAWTPS